MLRGPALICWPSDWTSSALVDSAPGHQEILKPPSGGFFIYGLAGLDAIGFGYPHLYP